MKRLPIYLLIASGYTIILIGVVKLYNSLVQIETIDIPASTIQTTKIAFVPLLIISVFVFVILISIAIYLLAELWKYFLSHKTLLPIPFLLIALGFVQLSMSVMNGVKTMIESNVEQFATNIDIYVNGFSSLTIYTTIGIVLVAASACYSFYLKLSA